MVRSMSVRRAVAPRAAGRPECVCAGAIQSRIRKARHPFRPILGKRCRLDFGGVQPGVVKIAHAQRVQLPAVVAERKAG